MAEKLGTISFCWCLNLKTEKLITKRFSFFFQQPPEKWPKHKMLWSIKNSIFLDLFWVHLFWTELMRTYFELICWTHSELIYWTYSQPNISELILQKISRREQGLSWAYFERNTNTNTITMSMCYWSGDMSSYNGL